MSNIKWQVDFDGDVNMKTTKLVLALISMFEFVIMVIQAFASGYYGEATGNMSHIYNAGGGLITSLFVLAGGIAGISTRKSKAGGIISGSIYLFGGFLGIFTTKSVNVFMYWSIMSIAFGTVFVLGSIFMEGKRE